MSKLVEPRGQILPSLEEGIVSPKETINIWLRALGSLDEDALFFMCLDCLHSQQPILSAQSLSSFNLYLNHSWIAQEHHHHLTYTCVIQIVSGRPWFVLALSKFILPSNLSTSNFTKLIKLNIYSSLPRKRTNSEQFTLFTSITQHVSIILFYCGRLDDAITTYHT